MDAVIPYIDGLARRETIEMSAHAIGADRCRINADDLERWASIARRLEPVTPVVLLEVTDLHRHPCWHRLHRCANACRFAAAIADEPERTIAVSLAEDFERAAARGH